MAEKEGKGGHGKEKYSLKTGRYMPEDTTEVERLEETITGKGDLEKISQEIIEANKEKIINTLKNIIGFENISDIKINSRTTSKEKNDDNHGIDYYLKIEPNKISGIDDKTGVNTKNFAFEIFKSVNGKEITAWFTNKYKINDLISFSNLITDENSNVKGCEYDFFDMSCLANCVYETIGLTDPNINPDNYLYALGRNISKNTNLSGKTGIRFNFKKDGKVVDGVYIRIKNKVNDGRGPTISVSLEIDKDKIRKMCEDDEHQFISI